MLNLSLSLSLSLSPARKGGYAATSDLVRVRGTSESEGTSESGGGQCCGLREGGRERERESCRYNDFKMDVLKRKVPDGAACTAYRCAGAAAGPS